MDCTYVEDEVVDFMMFYYPSQTVDKFTEKWTLNNILDTYIFPRFFYNHGKSHNFIRLYSININD